MVSALESLDGMKGRACPVTDIQKNTGPLMVFDQTKETEEQHLCGDTGLMQAVFQIHVLHDTYMKMRILSENAKSALKSLRGQTNGCLWIESVSVELATPDLWEIKASLFRRTYNVTFFYQIKEE